MSLPMRTSDVYVDVVSAAVRAHFDYSAEDIFSQIRGKELLTEYEPDVPAEQLSGLAGAGYGTLTVEGQQYGYNRFWREYPVTLTLRKYSSELAYTEEDIHWIKKANEAKRTNKVAEIASNALRPLVGNINRDVARMLYLGFGTTFFTGGDTLALFSASHTIRRTGGTQTNIVTSAPALSTTAVQTAIDQMNRFQGMNGIQLAPVTRLRLVVPVELEKTARQIVDSLYGPTNALLGLQASSKEALSRRGIDLDVVVLPEIPQTTYQYYWWLVDLDRATNRFMLGWGWKPRVQDDVVKQSGTYTSDSSVYFGPVAVGWQWVIGSNATS